MRLGSYPTYAATALGFGNRDASKTSESQLSAVTSPTPGTVVSNFSIRGPGVMPRSVGKDMARVASIASLNQRMIGQKACVEAIGLSTRRARDERVDDRRAAAQSEDDGKVVAAGRFQGVAERIRIQPPRGQDAARPITRREKIGLGNAELVFPPKKVPRRQKKAGDDESGMAVDSEPVGMNRLDGDAVDFRL